MTPGTPSEIRFTSERYFGLVTDGLLDPNERVELLEGVVVAMVPQNERHASGVARAQEALRAALSRRAVVRVQLPFRASAFSVPEPDVAVVPGTLADYDLKHPDTALLIVEVSDSSLVADRLSKSRIYAGAGLPELWLVNLRDDVVEIFREPDPSAKVYTDCSTACVGDEIELAVLPGDMISVSVADLIPSHA